MKVKNKFRLIVCVLTVTLLACTEKIEEKQMITEDERQQDEQQQDTHVYQEKGLELQYFDQSIRPQDDIYHFVNGNWMKTEKIPADKSVWGSFSQLVDKAEKQQMDMLDDLSTKHYEANTEGRKIQILYSAYTNTDKRDALGVKIIQAKLDKIDAITDLKELEKYAIAETKEGFGVPFYGWSVSADMKNSLQNAVYLYGGKIGLSRDYYQKQAARNTEVIERYQQYIKDILVYAGYEIPAAELAAKNIIDLEKKIAATLLTVEEKRDYNKQYNLYQTDEINSVVTSVDLAEYLKDVAINETTVIIPEIKYFQALDGILKNTSLTTIKDYMKFHKINSYAGFLDDEIEQLNFEFQGKFLNGQQENTTIEQKALDTINNFLGEAFGQLYVEKHFPQQSKKDMEELISYLLKTYEQRIKNLQWMSEETKAKALTKLAKFTVKVAYPDKWEDYSDLYLSEHSDLIHIVNTIAKWQYNKNLQEVGQAVDKTKWGMPPQTVNAYYSPSNNEIVFPAAILQAPFFNPQADPAINFGAIGGVIGHEISHGFDNSGSSFDGDGNLVNWWTDEDKSKFTAVTDRLVAQYNQYEPLKGFHVNGEMTLGENIADLAGASIAYDALQLYLQDKGQIEPISGYTQNQRFFLSWVALWRTMRTDERTMHVLRSDVHSPGEYRAFGPLINIPAFQTAFDIKKGDKLYKEPEDMIIIW